MARAGRPRKEHTVCSIRLKQNIRDMLKKTSEETGITMTELIEQASLYYIQNRLYEANTCTTKK